VLAGSYSERLVDEAHRRVPVIFDRGAAHEFQRLLGTEPAAPPDGAAPLLPVEPQHEPAPDEGSEGEVR
jgi:hypothetical protein